jgi:hypothetical protein
MITELLGLDTLGLGLQSYQQSAQRRALQRRAFPDYDPLGEQQMLAMQNITYKQQGVVKSVSAIQCEGCGATHNKAKCPYCGRLNIK